jgi:integrase
MHDEVTRSQERIYQNRHSATYGYERGKRSTSRCCQVLWPIRMREYPRVPRELKLPPEFVLYSLRHTSLTRLGEQGRDAFTIMRIAGHSTIVTSQRYVHPSAESVEPAIGRMESANEQADVLADRTDPKTDTVLSAQSVSH